MIWLKNNSLPGEKVFSHYSKGFFIEHWAGLPVLTDAEYAYAVTADQIFKDSEEIFGSNNLVLTSKLLQKNNISYVLVTEDMRQDLVWEKPHQGLDFLLSNNETFKKLYSNNLSPLWTFVPGAK